MGKAHVYIYGSIDYWEDEFGSEWGYVNLKNVKNQLDNQKDADEIVVHIHSYGGSVYTGFAIHDLLKAQGKPVTTQVEGVCASIASIIFLAGTKRIVGEASQIMIHNPWGYVGGEAEDVEKYAAYLRDLEYKIANIYSQSTTWTVEEALEKMKVETWIDQEEAISTGLATHEADEMSAMATIPFERKEMRAVALFKPDNDMSKENESVIAALKSGFEDIKAMFTKQDVKALKMKTGAGEEIDFYEIEKEEDVEPGAKAKIDGASASGDYVMPDGRTFVFDSGKLTEIKEAEGDDVSALKEEISTLKASLTAKEEEVTQMKADQEAFQNNVNVKLESVLAQIEGDFVLEDEKQRESASEKKVTNSTRGKFKLD